MHYVCSKGGGEGAVREQLLRPSRAGEPRAFGHHAGAVLAGKQTVREREVRDVRQPELLGDGQRVLLVRAVQEVQLVLHADEAGRPLLHGGGGLEELGTREVRAADLADLPFADQAVEGSERVGDRGRGVGLVELVQIDTVGAQPPEAVLESAPDVGGCCAPARPIDLHPELRRDDDAIPPTLQDPSEERLALCAAVDVRRVEEGHAGFERGVDDASRSALIES